MSRSVSQIVAGCMLVGCAPSSTSDADLHESIASSLTRTSGRFELRVSLYPWVPEPDAFISWIESDFEAKNPDIDLVIRPLVASYEGDPGYIADLAYEPDQTVAALTDAQNPDHQHLVEIDTLILGTLAERNAIVPFNVPRARFLPFAAESVSWRGRRMGVPHWTCGNFLISEQSNLADVDDVEELVATLRATGTERVDLAGDLGGSWGTIATYLDAFRDTYPNRDMAAELTKSVINPVVAGQLGVLREACVKGGVNFCGADAAELFATGGADVLLGFSERLNTILAHPDRTVGELHIASAPLGAGDHSIGFVDALVLSSECTARCRGAAQRFATYYISDQVFEVSLMALDTTADVPRYLLPSTSTAFEYGLVKQDRFYRELRREIRGTRALPNTGVPEARRAGVIRPQVEAALGL